MRGSVGSGEVAAEPRLPLSVPRRAARAGKRVSPRFVECALTVDPRPERRRRLLLDAAQRRAAPRGVDEIARGLGLDPGPVAGRFGGKPIFIADLGALFERRPRRMAAPGRRGDAIAHLRDAAGEERAEAIAAAVIPEEAAMPETPARAETRTAGARRPPLHAAARDCRSVRRAAGETGRHRPPLSFGVTVAGVRAEKMLSKLPMLPSASSNPTPP